MGLLDHFQTVSTPKVSCYFRVADKSVGVGDFQWKDLEIVELWSKDINTLSMLQSSKLSKICMPWYFKKRAL